MSTDIRPEVSKKSEYWLSKHRYYELLHWCRQYDEWWEDKTYILNTISSPNITGIHNQDTESVVEKAILKLDKLNNKISLLDSTLKEADEELYEYLLLSVTKGKGFTFLKQIKEIPCSKNYFYNSYRRFFWILDKKLE